jgi:hypothetical protein
MELGIIDLEIDIHPMKKGRVECAAKVEGKRLDN